MALVLLVVFLFLQTGVPRSFPCSPFRCRSSVPSPVMHLLGYSINTLTLFGMVLAIGIVVDDAIVVLENVERIMHEEHSTRAKPRSRR